MSRHSDFNRLLVLADDAVDPVFGLVQVANGTVQTNDTTQNMAVSALWPFSKVKRLWQNWVNDRHLRLSIARLQDLSEHLLADIGIPNDEEPGTAHKASTKSLKTVNMGNSQQS